MLRKAIVMLPAVVAAGMLSAPLAHADSGASDGKKSFHPPVSKTMG